MPIHFGDEPKGTQTQNSSARLWFAAVFVTLLLAAAAFAISPFGFAVFVIVVAGIATLGFSGRLDFAAPLFERIGQLSRLIFR